MLSGRTRGRSMVLSSADWGLMLMSSNKPML